MRWRRWLGFEPLEDRRLLTTIAVNTLIDVNNAGDGLTTLREAVAAAAANDTINFSVTGTINLTSTGGGQINVNKNLTIQGPGSNLLTIKAFDPDANGNNDSDGNRVFYVNGSGTLNVTISGLTLTNGDPEVTSENNGGGAILNLENLTLNACVVTDSFAPNGGAIYSPSGTLIINDSTISSNAGGDGAGLLIEGGTLSLNRTTVANNHAKNSGAGILNRGRTITIVDSTISGNTTDEHGGGIYTYQGNLSVTGSTISGNASDFDDDQSGSGGGIYNKGGGLTVTSSTVSGNASGEDGGGIFSDTSQTITINHSTIFGNSVTNHSSNHGGGIRSIDTATLNHTIVAGNLKGSTPDDVSGSVNASFSLISPANPSLVAGPLANNGGLTKTHALLAGSPAIDAGDVAAVAGAGGIPQFDQRGTPFSRVVDFDGVGGAHIDIGAIEMTLPAPALPGDYNRNNVVDTADYVLWRNTLGSSVQQYSGADGDGSGMIGSGDFTVWRAHFGQTPPGAATAEPNSPEAADGVSENVAAFAALARPTDVEPAAKVALKREPPASDSESAIDRLLAIDPRYADDEVGTGGPTSDDHGTLLDDNYAVDAALELICDLEAVALGW